MLAPILLLPVAVGPAISVEVAAGDDALRGWLAARLLEEGYDVAPTPAAAVAGVRVGPEAGGVAVTAWGSGQRSYAVEDGPAAVQRLEILHRALLGVEATLPADADHVAAPGLAVRLSGDRDDLLLADLANAARDAGVSLRTEPLPDDVLACVQTRGGLAEIGLGPATDGCAPADSVVALGDDGQRRQAAALIVQRAAAVVAPQVLVPEVDADLVASDELARIVADGERSAGAHAEPAPLPEVVVAADAGDPIPLQGPPRAEVRVAFEGGIVTRGPVDASMRGRLRLGRIDGIGGRLEIAAIPSRGANVRVVDTMLLVGPDWQLGKRERVRALFGATIGADIHHYATDVSTAADVDWAAELPVEVSIGLRGGARLELSLHPGLSGVLQRHESNNLGTWERAAWRIGVAVGFSHGWRIE